MKQRCLFYLLPNLLTTTALFFGFFSVVSILNMAFDTAAITLFLAILLDGMDGRVARFFHAESSFGAHYDSIADVVSFGLAPALFAYQYSLFSLEGWGFLIAFTYMAAAALRLARFGVQHDHIDSRFFQGLPSPAAAALIASIIWVDNSHALFIGAPRVALIAVFTVAAALLMVSNIRFYSFKKLNPDRHRLFVAVVFLAVPALLLLLPLSLALPVITLSYIFCSLFAAFFCSRTPR